MHRKAANRLFPVESFLSWFQAGVIWEEFTLRLGSGGGYMTLIRGLRCCSQLARRMKRGRGELWLNVYDTYIIYISIFV